MCKGISFVFISRYLECSHYKVYGDGEPYRISLRERVGSYERSIFRGTAREWQILLSETGLLRRSAADEPIKQSVVDAFNTWCAEEFRQAIESSVKRHGAIREDSSALAPPPAARGGRYDSDRGWLPIDGSSASNTARAPTSLDPQSVTA